MIDFRDIMNYIDTESSKILNNQNYLCFIYGSSIYNFRRSDIDLCFIVEHIDSKIFNELKEMIISLHLKYQLPIDDEVPFENKLIYTFQEAKGYLNDNIFENKEGIIDIPEIIASSDYLKSRDMKVRLLYNILTTKNKSISYNVNRSLVDGLRYKAWKLIIQTIVNYYNLDCFHMGDLINLLQKDLKGTIKGEDFLGYKDNNIDKDELFSAIYKMKSEGLLNIDENLVNVLTMREEVK